MTEDPKEPRNGEERPASDRARERVDSLSGEGPDRESSSSREEGARKPVLTERQRREARRARQAKRRSRRKPVEGNVISKGVRATGLEIRRTAVFLGNGVLTALAALGPVFSSAGMGLVWLIDRCGRGLRALRRGTGRAVAAAGRVALALDRLITPHRALLLIAGIGAVILGISQYKGLGQIEIGQQGYTGIEDLARAPAIDKTTPAGVHTRIFVPIAAVALLAVIVIALGTVGKAAGRLARFGRLAAMTLVTIGLLTLVVTLLIDLPDATDTSEAALAYAGVKARLLSGFWLELAAGATLAATGLALLLEPRGSRARAARRERRPAKVESGRMARQVNGGSA